MSLIIFFGMALCIFTLSSIFIGVTFYRWHQVKKSQEISK